METDKTPTAQDTTQGPVDATPKVNEPTPVKAEPTPAEAPKTLTLEEAEKLAQLARMDSGRERKEMEVERDSIKLRLADKETELEDIVAEREKLKANIDELASNDPAKFNIVKKDRELMERERKLKVDTATLETDKQAHGERVKLAEDTLREVVIWETALEYEGGDAVKLKMLCDTFGATTTEQMTKVAGTIWAKKTAGEPETPTLKPVSGRTSGGGGFTPDKKDPSATLQEGFRVVKK